MSKFEKLIFKLLAGTSDKNFAFEDLQKIVVSAGFILKKINGSHHIYYKEGLEEILNLQPKDGKAKPYQVKQVREIIIKYKLWKDGTE